MISENYTYMLRESLIYLKDSVERCLCYNPADTSAEFRLREALENARKVINLSPPQVHECHKLEMDKYRLHLIDLLGSKTGIGIDWNYLSYVAEQAKEVATAGIGIPRYVEEDGLSSLRGKK